MNLLFRMKKFFKYFLKIFSNFFFFFNLDFLRETQGCSCGVMVKSMDCKIVVNKLELQTRYYVYFLTDTLRKDMNLLIFPSMGYIVPLLFF